MKSIKYSLLFGLCFSLFACSNESNKQSELPIESPPKTLPFKVVNLDDLTAFKPVAENWKIVGNANVDQTNNATFATESGKGILLNTPEEGKRENLFSSFDHGDIEVELDVMMADQSNSGIYLQGRYEVQLFDSWNVASPQHSDMGGIYQRWDDSREQKGYEGQAPKMNAAKAPGLWQHFKIKFQAARFDASGNKTQNALFQEVWLNGVLLHENQEVTGPTRAGAFQDEKALGPLMFQGDHGAVAFRNIEYKLYENKEVSFVDMKLTEYAEYETATREIPDLNSLTVQREVSTETISSTMASGENPQRLLAFNGMMNIPNAGDYIFDMTVDGGGMLLLINNDTIIALDGDYYLNSPKTAVAFLPAGNLPFTLIYNKHRPFRRGFYLAVEGPGIAKHNLHASSSIDPSRLAGNGPKVLIEVSDETVLQRGFLIHDGIKKTHSIFIGTPQRIHYSYDLENGSLLHAWGGDFLDATGMWVGRGSEQLGFPIGDPISSFGGPDFAYLRNERTSWPDSIPASTSLRQLGYELDQQGNPIFSMELNGSLITNKFVPSATSRSLKRVISTNSDKELWHKLAEGSIIEKLSDDTYVINDKMYFIQFSGNDESEVLIRKSDGNDELLINIPSGNQETSYTLSW